MKILAIDCTAKPASVAVTEDGKILGSADTNTGLTHSETLVPMVDSVLRDSKLSLQDIDYFAINAGPGSFTGVRIGVAALKGLTFLGKDNCVATSTLESLAYNFIGLPGLKEYLVAPAMDARRNQVYTALFSVDGNRVERLTEDAALPIAELGQQLKTYGRPVLFCGDGGELCYNTLQEELPEALLAPPRLQFQHAASVAALAAAKLEAGETPVSSEDILPVYLRAPQAERELKKKQQEA